MIARVVYHLLKSTDIDIDTHTGYNDFKKSRYKNSRDTHTKK